LTTNGLTTNGLTTNGLTTNGLAPTSLAALRDQTATGGVTRLFFRYLVSCALPAGHDVTYTWTDAAAVVHKEVAGYGGLMVHEDEGHITTIAVEPDLQHAGIGTRLMLDLMEEARNRAARTVALEVRVANWPAQRLYSWFGFRPVGVRKNYYAETGEDALVMWVDDVGGEEIDGRLARIREAIDG